jgi:glycosyltransferase involved in cell wall biosynthesis
VKVAIVSHDVRRGHGQGLALFHLARHLARRGLEVHCFLRTADPLLSEDLPRGSIVVHHLRVAAAGNLVKTLSFALLAQAAVQRHSFDAIHDNGTAGMLLPYAVNTCHFSHTIWMRRQAELRRVLPAVPWRTRLGPRGIHQRAYSHTHAALERLSFARGQGWVAGVSDQVAHDLRVQLGIPETRVRTVPYGVDAAVFRPPTAAERTAERRRLGIAGDDAFVGLFAGDVRLPRKGLPYLLDAWTRLGPGNRRLLIAADRASYSSPEQLDRIGDLDRAGIQFLGHLPQARLAGVYRGVDAFLFPTLYDTFGLVGIEAMASGLPVVTSRWAGVSQLIEDGQNGVVLPNPTDVGALGRALTTLEEDAAGRRLMGERARATAEAQTWARQAERYQVLYSHAPGSGGS